MKTYVRVPLAIVSFAMTFLMLFWTFKQMGVAEDLLSTLSFSFMMIFFLVLGILLVAPEKIEDTFLSSNVRKTLYGVVMILIGLYLVVQSPFGSHSDLLTQLVKILQAFVGVVCLSVGTFLVRP
jgi:drug/metabolite transporter (DMT)-like permease